MKIKVKVLTEGCMPTISKNGDWIDLRAAKDMYFNNRGNVYYIPLGVAMKLPDGFEAVIASRSSTPKKLNLFIPNGIGVIDNSYQGDGDQWYFAVSQLDTTVVYKGYRVCQFRVQLSQKATLVQKLKWLFSSKIELVRVDSLGGDDRGGLGSTGLK